MVLFQAIGRDLRDVDKLVTRCLIQCTYGFLVLVVLLKLF